MAGWYDEDYLQVNTTMLHNLMESLSSSANNIEHVSILQGTKAYGFHLGPMPVPARERARGMRTRTSTGSMRITSKR